LEAAGAEQKAQFDGQPGLTGVAAGEGGDRLGHHLHSHPRRQAAVGQVQQSGRLNF